MGACGLKYQYVMVDSVGPVVTPYGGVWIEILGLIFMHIKE